VRLGNFSLERYRIQGEVMITCNHQIQRGVNVAEQLQSLPILDKLSLFSQVSTVNDDIGFDAKIEANIIGMGSGMMKKVVLISIVGRAAGAFITDFIYSG
jgi:hypothetical protein